MVVHGVSTNRRDLQHTGVIVRFSAEYSLILATGKSLWKLRRFGLYFLASKLNNMKIKRNVWNETFKDKGKVFTKPQEDIPKIAKIFKKYNIKRVLDLGCGSGRHLVFLARHGFDVYGIDMAKSGIKISKEWLDKEGLKANLKIRDIYKKLPYKNNFFDAIVSTQTLHHEKIEKIRKLISEMKRVLKINGLIFVTVLDFKCIPNKKQIAPRNFILLKGNDVGVPHYSFNKNILRKEFKDFKILNIWHESSKRHYCLLCQKKMIK